MSKYCVDCDITVNSQLQENIFPFFYEYTVIVGKYS